MNHITILILQILFLWFAIAFVGGLTVVLKHGIEEKAYAMIFVWFISPFMLIGGLLFVKPSRKKLYFQKLKTILFIN
jgi:hypothetical protein